LLLDTQVNFIFFINIIYSLFNKLKAFNTQDSYKHRHRSNISCYMSRLQQQQLQQLL